MHEMMISKATHEQIKGFLIDFMDRLKIENDDLYNKAEDDMYDFIYGCHFTDWTLAEALKGMVNDDGTMGPHWSVDETSRVANSNGIALKSYNEFDWCYVMNMLYSDYSSVLGNDANLYCKLAYKFLTDEDGTDGKAYKYYRMNHS